MAGYACKYFKRRVTACMRPLCLPCSSRDVIGISLFGRTVHVVSVGLTQSLMRWLIMLAITFQVLVEFLGFNMYCLNLPSPVGAVIKYVDTHITKALLLRHRPITGSGFGADFFFPFQLSPVADLTVISCSISKA